MAFASHAPLLLLALLAACSPRVLPASSLPPASVPAVDTSAPVPEGHGRVVIDVEEGPVPIERLELEPRPVSAEATHRWRFEERPVPVCVTTPCAVDLPHGNVLLGFPMVGGEAGMRSRDLLHIGPGTTVYRRHLDIFTPRRGGMVGTGGILLPLGLGGAIAGAVLLPRGLNDGDDARTIAGAVSLGVGAAMFAFGYWLIQRGRPSIRPGSSVHFSF